MNELLEIETSNFKALFLRGSAYYHLNEIPLAYQDFLRAGDIEPGNTSIARYIQEIEEAYPEICGEPQQSGMCQNGTSASTQSTTKQSPSFIGAGGALTRSTDSDIGITGQNKSFGVFNSSVIKELAINKRGKIQSNNSTNANSGSEGGYQSTE